MSASRALSGRQAARDREALVVITFAEMNGLSRRSSENLRGPSLKDQSTSGVQQPRSKSMHFDMGQPGGAFTVFLTLRTIALRPGAVSNWLLENNGNHKVCGFQS